MPEPAGPAPRPAGRDPEARLRASIVSTSSRLKPVDEAAREPLSRPIALIGGRIVVRAPLADARP